MFALIIIVVIYVINKPIYIIGRGTIDPDVSIEYAEISASILSEAERECIREVGRTYGTNCENKVCKLRELFELGFSPPNFMKVNDDVIGISFVYKKMYPEDYEFNRFHAECGVCYIYDEFIENIPSPDPENISSSVEVFYSRQIEENIYCYVGIVYR